MQSKKNAGAVVQELDGDLSEDAKDDGVTSPIKLDETAQALIGHHLRTLYGEIVREPVPEHLINLLQELERKENK